MGDPTASVERFPRLYDAVTEAVANAVKLRW